MLIEDLDINLLSQLVTEQIDQVTCLECCKYYVAPETASCGHSLCHLCWKKRRTCPICATLLERRSAKLNRPLHTLTEHVQNLGNAFEKLFKTKLDEFTLETPKQPGFINGPIDNVKEWLASSQNQFTNSALNSGQSSQDTVKIVNKELSANEFQVHTKVNTVKNCSVVVPAPAAQDDWDKIEVMPDSDAYINKENIAGPMDIEPFSIEDQEYTTQNPRRSSRMRDLNISSNNAKTENNNALALKQNKETNSDIEKNSIVVKQNWNNVKRMRKEFSKLNKKNRNKLNVSIEMAKKTQISNKQENIIDMKDIQELNCEIDENTPNIESKKKCNELNKGCDLDEKNQNIDKRSPEINIPTALNGIGGNTDNSSSQVNFSQEISTSLNTTKNLSKSEKKPSLNEKTKTTTMPFLKKSSLCPQSPKKKDENIRTVNHVIDTSSKENTNDDIEISIKIGNTVTNIFIRKKENDVQLKVNTDREIQTTLGPYDLVSKVQNINQENIQKSTQENQTTKINTFKKIPEQCLKKSVSTKHNTSSADTATAHFDITESVEKELSNMNMENFKQNNNIKENQSNVIDKNADIELLNDLDIFSASMTDNNVKLLSQQTKIGSKILTPRAPPKLKTQQSNNKRIREPNEEDLKQSNKKTKLISCTGTFETAVNDKSMSNQNDAQESEPINYDVIMDQVFANIDADIEDTRKIKTVKEASNLLEKTVENHTTATQDQFISKTQRSIVECFTTDKTLANSQTVNENKNQKDSENIFSVCENHTEFQKTTNSEMPDTVHKHMEDTLTPALSQNVKTPLECLKASDDDCDSVVEETPQKCHSFNKGKQKENSTVKECDLGTDLKQIKSVINLTDTAETNESKDVTVVNTNTKKQTLDTPLTINKFVDQIKHKSTPMARKSLNFESEQINVNDDPEQTFCPPTEALPENTQEKEFMKKIFDKSQTTQIARALGSCNSMLNNKDFCVAGSCLTSAELKKLKVLCSENKWCYVDKYTNNLTHLVVGVDEEKKSQRSVKYMCALAAGKWIVSFEWVEKCLHLKKYVDEAPYEALDSTGEPGPKRSRISKRKLFHGITFYCMPSFTVLDLQTLKSMLEAAGGRVVTDPKYVRISKDAPGPALLLAEPENTQEDRFIYLAMEQSIVPVNYEWALNCLGSYTLGSVQELLLCPAALLPTLTSQWPACLIAREYDD
ncbi:breast cancer type 1 susceptibility protein homolog [Bombyx mandarina]|uniref:Breast cancer type 1 susceptibility protein homolog n=1 Tax=Bombyx mandarina TaxID=7092 RepID=A0A6J2KJB9_BOMMA|nr:breast cancer type 1 susceptibility protein homolog [Bombyx mandarina]